MSQQVVWVTTPNIAVIKYWGKRDAAAMAPLNSSLSIALGADTLRTLTTATLAPAGTPADELEMNGVRVAPGTAAHARFARCLARLRANLPASAPAHSRRVLVRSRNSFPTGAGVASSASGLAGVAVAAAHALGIPAHDPAVAHAARMGSGSACRSCLGGFVLWRCDPELNTPTPSNPASATANDPSSDPASASTTPGPERSCVEAVADAAHWPGLRLAVLLASAREKRVGSTAGMQQTVATSDLLAARVARVPAYIDAAARAIAARDLSALAACAMRDSNQLHAVCLDTTPPLVYMTDVGHAACALVHALNAVAGAVVAGYTFDAGPNPVLLADARDMPLVLSLFAHFFPGFPEKPGDASQSAHTGLLAPAALARIAEAAGFTEWHERSAFVDVLVCKVGEGPFAVAGDITEPDEDLLARPHLSF